MSKFNHRALRIARFLACLLASTTVVGAASAKEAHAKPAINDAKHEEAGRAGKDAPQPPVVVQLKAPDKTREEIEQEAAEHQKKLDEDRLMVEFTGQLARYTYGLFVATAALVAATIALVVLGVKQGRDTKESLKLAKEAADAALLNAKAAVMVALPFLEVVEHPTKPGYARRAGAAGDPYPASGHVVLRITNFGQTPADLREIRHGLHVGDPFPATPHYAARMPAPANSVVKKDESNGVIGLDFAPSDSESDALRSGASAWVFGEIGYADFMGGMRHKRFCLKWNRPQGGFDNDPNAPQDYIRGA
ncbi:hypothetical protein [Methylosinus sp. RM1]|uniref:hypothetical protein n=1 Tax=Methylosinus sp. RM1 TaxID=2583817 RepID=UPI001409775A|nr:hypothetical protein [Methylosinus sp. RM1]